MFYGRPEDGLPVCCEKRWPEMLQFLHYRTGDSGTLPGMGNEHKKHTSLLKDFTTKLYPGWDLSHWMKQGHSTEESRYGQEETQEAVRTVMANFSLPSHKW